MKSLQELRREAGMSRQELAEASEISEPTLQYLEQQKTSPQHDVRRRLEIVFNARINWLTTCGVKEGGERMFWEEVEKDYRRAIVQIVNLPVHERDSFLTMAREYLNDLEEIMEEEEKRNSTILLPTEMAALKANRKINN